MEAAEDRRIAARQAQVTKEEAQMERERESLELSKVRILRELEAASHPRHREQLAAALAHLEQQLKLKTSRAPAKPTS